MNLCFMNQQRVEGKEWGNCLTKCNITLNLAYKYLERWLFLVPLLHSVIMILRCKKIIYLLYSNDLQILRSTRYLCMRMKEIQLYKIQFPISEDWLFCFCWELMISITCWLHSLKCLLQYIFISNWKCLKMWALSF